MVDITAELPRLTKSSGEWELLVDGKPFLILGGELQNSSMTSAAYMDEVWQKLVDMGLNTVLGVVAWEDIEPEEDRFDFTELDLILKSARSYGLRLIVLWFGSFKNGLSSYVPSWVKLDANRFPRMKFRKPEGGLETSGVISIFHDECVKTDAKAFATLMKHLSEVDPSRTVIMVQVENEVGFLRDSRDQSTTANDLFESPVPRDLVEYLKSDWDALLPDLKQNFPELERRVFSRSDDALDGSWNTVFGEGIHTNEIFTAYHYALFVERVAAAGRQAYDVPLFTNAWLPKPKPTSTADGVISGGRTPGEYPSGGPVPGVLDIWMKFAPTLDMVCPDIHSADYTLTSATYRHRGQALFIPEQKRDESGARRVWQSIGRFKGLGAGPFGIDTVEPEDACFTRHYKLLGSVSQLILKARTKPDSIFGFFFDDLGPDGEDPSPPITKAFGTYELTISRAFVFGKQGPGFGIIINNSPGKFLLIGMGFRVEFKSTSPRAEFTGILKFHEMRVVDASTGELRKERSLNGDETRQGRWANMPNERPDMAGYTPICIPARTMIAEVEVYALET